MTWPLFKPAARPNDVSEVVRVRGLNEEVYVSEVRKLVILR